MRTTDSIIPPMRIEVPMPKGAAIPAAPARSNAPVPASPPKTAESSR